MITGSKRLYNLFIVSIMVLTFCRQLECKRSIHRKEDPYIPYINVSWNGESKKFILKDYHLDEYPFFKLFNRDYFNNHMLPDTPISFQYEPDKSITKDVLTQQI